MRKIYKIVNNVNDEIYVGSTKNELRKRFQGHKDDSKKEKNKDRMLYVMVNEIGWDCFRIILIENFECETKEEQLIREQHWIDLLKPSLNMSSAYGSICEHNRRRNTCKDCGGGSICDHNKQRIQCVFCGGSQICVHNKRRSQCVFCGGSQICLHKRMRSQCKDCNPYICFCCNIIVCNYKRHLKSIKHSVNENLFYFNVF